MAVFNGPGETGSGFFGVRKGSRGDHPSAKAVPLEVQGRVTEFGRLIGHVRFVVINVLKVYRYNHASGVD